MELLLLLAGEISYNWCFSAITRTSRHISLSFLAAGQQVAVATSEDMVSKRF